MSDKMKKYFADWESEAFGYGYGSGEEHILPTLMLFLSNTPEKGCYDYEKLEHALTPTVAWMMINVMCKMGALEYGTSPRGAWLTTEGKRLKEFVITHSFDELYEYCNMNIEQDDYIPCSLSACNCGPNGYWDGVECANPFFAGRVK